MQHLWDDDTPSGASGRLVNRSSASPRLALPCVAVPCLASPSRPPPPALLNISLHLHVIYWTCSLILYLFSYFIIYVCLFIYLLPLFMYLFNILFVSLSVFFSLFLFLCFYLFIYLFAVGFTFYLAEPPVTVLPTPLTFPTTLCPSVVSRPSYPPVSYTPPPLPVLPANQPHIPLHLSPSRSPANVEKVKIVQVTVYRLIPLCHSSLN